MDLATPSIADDLARLCVAAGASVADALSDVGSWLRPLEHPHYLVHLLLESGLCRAFPASALRLLGAVIAENSWMPTDLPACLHAIAEAAPQLIDDMTYRRLSDYARRRDG